MLAKLQSGAQAERVSLVTYSDDAAIDQLLTETYTSLQTNLNQHTATFDGGGTNIASGISEGADSLLAANGGRAFAAKAILVMTDGQRTVGGDPVSAAKNAANQGLMVFTVTFSSEADQGLMQAVAAAGGGKHFHAEKREDLLEVFRTIGAQLPTLIVK